jgi:hypothetical protein
MHLNKIKKKMEPWLKNSYLEPGDFCIIYLNGLATYAICTDLDEDPVPGWYDAHFIVFDRIPPHRFGFKVQAEHLTGDEFTWQGVPVAIIPLEISDVIPSWNGQDLVTEDNNEIIRENGDPFGVKISDD